MQLTRDQGLALLRKLAADDAFRAAFEKDPAGALEGIGVPAGALESLDSKCLEQRTLATKQTFEKLLSDVDSEEFQLAMSMHVHALKIG
jgi:putative modified peptide